MNWEEGMTHLGLLVFTHGLFAVAGAFTQKFIQRRKKSRKQKEIAAFFGLNLAKKTYVIHGTVYDKERSAYNFTSSDLKSVRYVSAMLDKAGLKESKEYILTTNVEIKQNELWEEAKECNLIILGGPKRNDAAHMVLEKLKSNKYDMRLNDGNENSLIRVKDGYSYDFDPHQEDDGSQGGIDYGLILRRRNPFNGECTVVILAGIHGVGTIGSSRFMWKSRRNRERLLCCTKEGGIEAVVRCFFSGTHERIYNVELVEDE